MLILTNIIIAFLVLLIAYWLSSQGLFSALLHLVCVIVAGAIALAFWEPLTMGVLLRGNKFDDYAWGVALVGLFSVSLVVLRLAMDNAAPSNVNIPSWANYAFGFPIGVCASILTLGILLIGMGFVQSHREIAGYQGYGRDARTAQVTQVDAGLWVPVHQWTSSFYEYLSDGALYPTFNNTPLVDYNPSLHRQSTLVRDSYRDGAGKLSLPPNAASIKSVLVDEGTNRYAIEVEFGPLARDFGQQLTLSSSQIRLICRRRGTQARPVVIHPVAWSQETSNAPSERFLFDDRSHYITSIPGRESATVVIEFDVPSNEIGAFLQIRGTRFRLPTAERVAPGSLGTGAAPSTQAQVPVPTGTGPSIQPHLQVSNDLRPFVASSNQLPGTISHNDRYLTQGEMTQRAGADRPTRSLMIRGIEEPAGTRIVQLDVSRGTTSDIFGPVRNQVPANAPLALVDANGNTYSPIGYLHEHRDGVTVRLDPARFIRTAEQLPVLPTSGTDRLRLIFRVTQNATIVAFRYGDVTVGTSNVEVPPPGRR